MLYREGFPRIVAGIQQPLSMQNGQQIKLVVCSNCLPIKQGKSASPTRNKQKDAKSRNTQNACSVIPCMRVSYIVGPSRCLPTKAIWKKNDTLNAALDTSNGFVRQRCA